MSCSRPWQKIYRINSSSHTVFNLPCNNCISCRIDRLLLWSARCNSEFIKYRSSFVTFTYDDNHLRYMSPSSVNPTLCRDDFSKYIDNLRHQIKSLPIIPEGNIRDFKFFACGEYGDLFGRPHYHVLFFGLDYLDFKRYFIDSWHNGSIKSLPITSGGIRYVVDYMTKSLNGPLAVTNYDNKGLERPFYSCSRGLGSDFFYAHRQEISDTGMVKIGSRYIPVPSYYKNLFYDFSNSSYLNRVKQLKKNYDSVMRSARKAGFNDYDSYLSWSRYNKEISNYKKFVNNGSPGLSTFDLKKSDSINLSYIVHQALDIA